MLRKVGIDSPGTLHHIIIRGIEHKKIFQDNTDRDNFLGRFGEILFETATSCYAWSLMPDYAHLLLRTDTHPLTTLIRRLLTGYAVSHNRGHRRHAQLFQNASEEQLDRKYRLEAQGYNLEMLKKSRGNSYENPDSG